MLKKNEDNIQKI